VVYDRHVSWKVALVMFTLVGCGRIGYDSVGRPTSDGAVPDGATWDGAASDGAAADGPTWDGAAADGATWDGAASDGGGGDPPPGASCVGLADSCGSTGTGSCCESPLVSGGTYYRGYDVGSDGAAGDMSNPATVSDFRLDKYEVTVGRFRMFVAAGQGTQTDPPAAGAGAHGGTPASGWDPGWDANLAADRAALVGALDCDATFHTWTPAPGGNESRPINCITWYEAMAFCIWDGGYLPTEAEWNYAASGGTEQRAYPWSSPPSSVILDASHASYYVDPTRECYGDGVNGCALTDLIVVGTKPAGDGRWGQSDLAGNVMEWALDWYAGYPNPCSDCANLTPDFGRVYRSGSFHTNSSGMRTGFRSFFMAETRFPYLGVRCARAP
jgi:formylglycine-generating enzyme required for sulfatase activity